MSTLKVNGIRHSSASSDAITLASDATCTAKITNNLSNRNLIINGAFQIAQRGSSATTNGYGTVDRWEMKYSGQDEAPTQATHALTSSDTGPWEKGFRTSWQLTNGNQSSGAGAADMFYIRQRFEAQDIANSGWDYTSSSSYITVSFWIKSSVAQVYYPYIKSEDGTAKYYFWSTGSLSADTWTKVTKTIPGVSGLQFDNNNAHGMDLVIPFFLGTDWTDNSASVNTWANWDSGKRSVDQTSTFWTTNDADIEITGVQLEVSEYPSDYEHLSYQAELSRCQRYYQLLAKGTSKFLGIGDMHTATQVDLVYYLLTLMRATPDIVQDTGGNYFAVNAASGQSGNVDGAWTKWLAHDGPAITIYATVDTSLTAGQAARISTSNASALLALEAEL